MKEEEEEAALEMVVPTKTIRIENANSLLLARVEFKSIRFNEKVQRQHDTSVVFCILAIC